MKTMLIAVLPFLTIVVLTASAAPNPAIAAGAVVENPTDPPDGVRTITLKETWRAGGEDDEVIFGSVMRVLSGSGGEVLVLDSQLSQVQVYDVRGQWLRSLSRAGEGPGEVRNPVDCFFLPDDRLCLAQGFPGRLVFVQPDGTPAGQAEYQPLGAPSTFSVMVGGRTAPDGMLLAGIRMNQGGGPQMQQTFFLSLCDIEGQERQVYLEKPYAIDFADFRMDEASMDFIWMGRMDIDEAGNVATAPERNRYYVQVQAPDGAVLREFTRKVTLPRRTAAERDVATQVHRAIAANYGGVPLQGVTIEDTEPAINGLWMRPDGAIWVRSPYNKPEPGVFAVIDVFDRDGRFTHQLALKAEGDPTRDDLFILADGRVVILRGGLDAWLGQQGVASDDADAALLEIVCHEAI